MEEILPVGEEQKVKNLGSWLYLWEILTAELESQLAVANHPEEKELDLREASASSSGSCLCCCPLSLLTKYKDRSINANRNELIGLMHMRSHPVRKFLFQILEKFMWDLLLRNWRGCLNGFAMEPGTGERSEGSTAACVPELVFGWKNQRGCEMPKIGTRPLDFKSHSF